MSIPLKLDAILPEMSGKMIALIGDVSTRRNQLVKQFILDGFMNEGTSCVVTLTTSANDLIEELNSYSPDATILVNDAILNEKLQIIDMYSFRGLETEEKVPGTHIMPSANDLTLLSIKLNEISKRFEKCRILIWPYSLLTIYTNYVDLTNFTQSLSARLSARSQIGLLLLDTGVILDHQKATLESLVDAVIEMRKDEKDGKVQEWFRIKFLKGIEDIKFDVWTLIS